LNFRKLRLQLNIQEVQGYCRLELFFQFSNVDHFQDILLSQNSKSNVVETSTVMDEGSTVNITPLADEPAKSFWTTPLFEGALKVITISELFAPSNAGTLKTVTINIARKIVRKNLEEHTGNISLRALITIIDQNIMTNIHIKNVRRIFFQATLKT
jgi:hypothetical protein